MRPFRVFAYAIACLMFLTGLTYGQGVGASGDIKGTVTDSNGAAVANATVTITDTEKGTKRTVTTDSTGQFRATGLPPATYNVTAEGSGFQPLVRSAVVVHVGETVVSDFHLGVSKVTEKIDVTSEAPVIETERGGQSNIVSQQYISNLPIDRRDYLSFSLLLPGVSDSSRMGDSADFRVKQTPQSGLAVYGSNGRGNSVTVDGGEADDDAGGVRITLGQDAVQEFQVNRSNYSAELGYGSGASINIVSKSGSNDLHGSLFGFLRNQRLDARDTFALTSAFPGAPFNVNASSQALKQALTRSQYGASAGFALIKDRTFLFISYEGLDRNASGR